VTWRVVGAGDGDPATVYPLNDFREHDPFTELCWCHPFWDGDVLVHNSMDRREEYENGRKMQ
jgi:hypothetical protein